MPSLSRPAPGTLPRSRLQPIWFAAPAAAALYPLTLQAYHQAASAFVAGAGAACWLAAALALLLAFVPTVAAVLIAVELGKLPEPSVAQLLARRVALVAAAVPPIYTLLGVVGFLLNHQSFDLWAATALWCALALMIALAPSTPAAPPKALSGAATWRTAHGVAAVLAVAYLCLHFSNHMFGWLGPAAHTIVMEKLRLIYRSRIGEPLLIASFIFLIVSGVRMAWHLTGRRADTIRTLQIAGGVFLVFAVVSHVNAVLYLARLHMNIESDWGFAIGAPAGLLRDAWNIRLLPYYLLAVFFVILHAFCGLRGVMLAHGVRRQVADRTLEGGAVVAAIVALLIIMAMCGLRVSLA